MHVTNGVLIRQFPLLVTHIHTYKHFELYLIESQRKLSMLITFIKTQLNTVVQ